MPVGRRRTFIAEQALFITTRLPQVSAEKVVLYLSSPEPTFDQTHWFTSRQEIALARIGMTPTGESRLPISVSDPSVVANWYHLCDSPREVWALYYQLGFEQLAIWRLAHMWEVLQ